MGEDEKIEEQIEEKEFGNFYSDLTVVTACDSRYYEKVNHTLPNWIHVKGLTCPFIVFVNGMSVNDSRLDPIKKYDNVTILPWDLAGAETQRERMLAAFILGVAEHVKTEFYVKFDAETVALNDDPWIREDFFEYDMVGQRWGYTKPGYWVPKIDYWMDGLSKIDKIKNFKGFHKRYKMAGDPDNPRKMKHKAKRVCSWIRIARTSMIQDIASNVHFDRLIIPSEDTLIWRWCERLGLKWGRHNFKQHGWVHSKRECISLADEAIKEYGQTNHNST